MNVSDFGTQQAVVVTVRGENDSDWSLTAACGFTKSIWRWDSLVVSISAYTSLEKQSRRRRYGSVFSSVIQTAVPRLRVNERRDGSAGSTITAAAAYFTTSASATRPCVNPCAWECRCLSQAGMGSAMENSICMRAVRRVRQTSDPKRLQGRLLLDSLYCSVIVCILASICTNPEEVMKLCNISYTYSLLKQDAK